MSKKLQVLNEKILWIDLEMTGLSPKNDLILEAAAIVTNWDFEELDTYHGIVKNPIKSLNSRMKANSEFWDKNPISRQGLIDQNKLGKKSAIIQAELIEFIDKNFTPSSSVLLGGNSIHCDRQFIASKWPELDKKLYYRMLDVSAWKVVFENKYGKRFLKPDTHRALDDIRGSIIELQYYLNNFKVQK